jgi:ketosteroid isomerase-like protein
MKYLLIVLSLLLFSCVWRSRERQDVPRPDVSELQITDSEFSDYSRQYGMRKAFLEYIDDEGIMMRDGALPVKGARTIEYIASLNDSAIVMTWEPQGGDISASGDLGYTYGIYEMRFKDSSGNVERGTYVTVWKKQEDGRWKVVLDSGNQGTGDD